MADSVQDTFETENEELQLAGRTLERCAAGIRGAANGRSNPVRFS